MELDKRIIRVGLVAFLVSPDARSFTGQTFDPNNGAWMG